MRRAISFPIFLLLLMGCGHHADLRKPAATVKTAATYGDSRRPRRISIQRPLYQGSAQSTFTYTYEVYSSPQTRQSPTVVYIPGGPGGASIGRGAVDNIPANWNALMTDPRALGVNPLPSDVVNGPRFSETQSSIQVAQDIVAAIKNERLNNYVVWGFSYGTVVGTIVANLISQDRGMAQPKALVLEGTLGKAYRDLPEGPSHEGFAGYVTGLENFFQSLSAEEQSVLQKRISELRPQRASVAEFFTSAASNGREEIRYYHKFLLGPIDDVVQEMEKVSHGQSRMVKPLFSEGVAQRVLEIIGCNEINYLPSAYPQVSIFGGALDIVDPMNALCSTPATKIPGRAHYDSKDFPISGFPIFYVQGEDDPNTPRSGVVYHKANQAQTRTELIILPGLGHSNLRSDDNDFVPCIPSFWDAIAQGGTSARAALNKCGKTK